ncbi:Hypothetical predicted protein [Olea europaea subsp. europaea]|uniref:Uncharacterized protein n=1 Tax=Olea europaea subsp. europaea TaxID=158383 RepID=A0A8S0UWG5_OLEEU|nr:Hypothetical predicted protein [Olea europaea subsp. europaea]
MGKKTNSNNGGRLPIIFVNLPNQDGKMPNTTLIQGELPTLPKNSGRLPSVPSVVESIEIPAQGKDRDGLSTNRTDPAKTFWQDFDHANSNSPSLSQTHGDEDTDSGNGSTEAEKITLLPKNIADGSTQITVDEQNNVAIPNITVELNSAAKSTQSVADGQNTA